MAIVQSEAEEIVTQLLTAPPDDPYPLYARLRTIAPIHRASVGDFWTLSRYEDLRLALKDKRFVRDYDDFRRRNSLGPVDYERPFIRLQRKWFVFSNPPAYGRKRALYNTAFNRPFVDGIRPRIAAYAAELLDAAEKRGELEVIHHLGYRLTVRLVCSVMGLPVPEDLEGFIPLMQRIAPTFSPLVTDEQLLAADEAALELERFMASLIEELRRHPGDNLISRMIVAAGEGERLTEDELTANAVLVFNASVGTTAGFIGNAVLSLMRNRDQWEQFKTDPEGLGENAVEELLRYDSPIVSDLPLHLAAEDVEIGGITIRAGEGFIPFIGAGNRDPARYENPDRLDLRRQDVRPLSFGGGIHICLGQYLARVEAQVALALLARRFPNMELIDTNPVWRSFATFRAPRELHVSLS
ncbi:MAG TPA: cytochrome P450 [Candidatus Dormibacteraeota bacterium]|nr:cytochrome P450 [Candidatus Dormibacteraeota bacterium]